MNTPLTKYSERALSNSSQTHWKWVVGSSAVAVGAAAIPVSARTVQITLTTEQVTNGNNTFTGDCTRDGVNDVPTWGAGFSTNPTSIFASLATPNTIIGYAWYYVGPKTFTVGVIPNRRTGLATPSSQGGLFPFTFSDARVNGGAATAAFADIRANNNSPTSHTVRILRSVFNDNGTAAPGGVVAGGVNTEFDATIYAQRTSLANKIKKLKKKAKKAVGNKAKKLKKKSKKLSKKLAAIQ